MFFFNVFYSNHNEKMKGNGVVAKLLFFISMYVFVL